jgi:hypothetical protein
MIAHIKDQALDNAGGEANNTDAGVSKKVFLTK